MARPQKKGLDYFPMDVDFYDDIKITMMTGRYGSDALAVYIYILCRIFKNSYCIEYNEDLVYSVARFTGVDAAQIEEIIEYAVNKGIFSKEIFEKSGVLTSGNIQDIYQEAVRTRGKKKKVSVDENWILPRESTASYIITPEFAGSYDNNDDYCGNNGIIPGNNAVSHGNNVVSPQKCTIKERKEKEKKGNNSKLNERNKKEDISGSREEYSSLSMNESVYDFPTVEEVRAYSRIKDMEYADCEGFLDYYINEGYRDNTDWRNSFMRYNARQT